MESSKFKNRLGKVKTYLSHIKEKVKSKGKSTREGIKKTVLEKEGRDISAI